jgi:uncharacterized protein (UPF0332 family)
VILEHDECIKRGKIKPFSRGSTLSPKELEIAKADLETARKTYKENDYKWATIQIYYSMFHSAGALLYAKNLREHSHYCLIAAIKTLYIETKQIPIYLLEALQEAKNLREEADYYNRWSQAGCEKLLKLAEEFLYKAESLVKK